jgi:hypothetical protein
LTAESAERSRGVRGERLERTEIFFKFGTQSCGAFGGEGRVPSRQLAGRRRYGSAKSESGQTKKQAAQGEARAAWLAKSSGEEGKVGFYIDDGLPVVGVAAGLVVSPTVFVIKRTSTRRLSARPVEVLFVSTGLSLPRPIT